MSSLFDYLEEDRKELVAEYEEKKRAERRKSAAGALRSGSPGNPLARSRTTESPPPQGLDESRHHRTRSDASALGGRPSRESLEYEDRVQPLGASQGGGQRAQQQQASTSLSSDFWHRQEPWRHSVAVVPGGTYYPQSPSSTLAHSVSLGTALPSTAAEGTSKPSIGSPNSPLGGKHVQKARADDSTLDDEAGEVSDNDGDIDELDDNDSGEEDVPSKHRQARGRTTNVEENGSTGGGRKRDVKFGNVIKNRGLSPYKGRTSGDPTITITGAEGGNTDRGYPHPNTSYEGGSAVATPQQSDAEDDDIKRAQRLAIRQSPVMTTAASHRTMLTLIRGDFGKMQLEAEQGLRRQRIYVSASDLSPEAAYALEWTIGACLRDGDTLLAVFAMNREGLGTGAETGGVAIGQGGSMMEDSNKIVQSFTDVEFTDKLNLSPLGASPKPHSEPDVSQMTKAERERYDAAVEIAATCVGLLRKTRLQVRVVVEVFHCESPKHMLTEVIDFIDPTLVVIGSRGRSSLRGVLLGSFSNYIVNKSSVPVMVARRRLRTHNKYRRENLRMSNMLNPERKVIMPQFDQHGKVITPKID